MVKKARRILSDIDNASVVLETQADAWAKTVKKQVGDRLLATR